jgi:hypothetical protein
MSKGSAAWMPWNDILNEEPGKMPKEVDEVGFCNKSSVKVAKYFVLPK